MRSRMTERETTSWDQNPAGAVMEKMWKRGYTEATPFASTDYGRAKDGKRGAGGTGSLTSQALRINISKRTGRRQ